VMDRSIGDICFSFGYHEPGMPIRFWYYFLVLTASPKAGALLMVN